MFIFRFRDLFLVRFRLFYLRGQSLAPMLPCPTFNGLPLSTTRIALRLIRVDLSWLVDLVLLYPHGFLAKR